MAAPQFGQGASGGACIRYSSSSSQIDFTACPAVPGSGGGAEIIGTSGEADGRASGGGLAGDDRLVAAAIDGVAGASIGGKSAIGASPKSGSTPAGAGIGCGT
jgi:hypothetical protein